MTDPEKDLAAEDSRLHEVVDEGPESLLVVHGVGTEYETHHRVVEERFAQDVDYLRCIVPAEPEDSLELACTIH